MLESQDLRDFSISTWYPMLADVTLKTVIIEITPELLRLLRSDDFNDDIKSVCSPDYIDRIEEALREFDRKAFVKNNWRAPTDAKFMSLGNTLQVNAIDDILVYFKASEKVANDFENDKFSNYCIALRQYLNVHPAAEFRCIVIAGVLRGITPRDWPTYYEHFASEGSNIIRLTSEFFQENLKAKFYRKNYIFDVIITPPAKVELMDLGPLNGRTNLYAFLWDEIDKLIKTGSEEMVAPVFRYLESDKGISLRPRSK